MTRRVRVGFLSAVRHAAGYIEALRRDDRVEIVAAVEDANAAEWIRDDSAATASRFGLDFSTDVDATLADGGLDLAVVCSEPTRHAALARAAMWAGIPVLIDKPAATTLDDAEELEELSLSTGVPCFVVNRTHDPSLRRVRRWIDAGHLGLPLHLDLEFFASGTHFSTSVERPQLVVDPALSGGGEIMNFLGYCVDAVTFLTGLPARSVHALSGTFFGAGHREHGVEDTAIVSLRLERGVTATISVGRLPYAPGLGAASFSMRVIGSHGHAVADDSRPAALQFGGGSPVSSLPMSGNGSAQALASYLGHVVDSVLGAAPPGYGISEALDSIRVIDAAYRSIARNSTVELE